MQKALISKIALKLPFLVEDEETLRYMEYLYLEAGEDLRVNLRLQQYNKMNTADYECEVSEDYSRTKVINPTFLCVKYAFYLFVVRRRVYLQTNNEQISMYSSLDQHREYQLS